MLFQIPFLAALGKHAGVVAEWLAVVDRINSGALDVASLKSNKALLESEKGAFSSTSVAIWTKVKALRQWIRGKKALFQQYVCTRPRSFFQPRTPVRFVLHSPDMRMSSPLPSSAPLFPLYQPLLWRWFHSWAARVC